MNTTYKYTRYEPTRDITKQAEQQVGGLQRFIDETKGEALAAVELSQEVGGQQKGDIWRAELAIEHEGKTYRAQSVKTKLANALTTVTRDVGEQLRKNHRRQESARKGGVSLKDLFRSRV